MIVLLSWEYFERLWCVYEWAAFLVCHEPTKVQICVDAFLRPDTQNLYIESIENFSVSKAKCFVEADRAILQAKVADYYHSTAAFELFAKSTAIGVIAVTVIRKAMRGTYDTEFLPWVELAGRCGLDDLVDVLRQADPSGWRERAMAEANEQAQGSAISTSRSTGAAVTIANDASLCLGKAQPWQVVFNDYVDTWFSEQVVPLLAKVKQECVRPGALLVIDGEEGTAWPTLRRLSKFA